MLVREGVKHDIYIKSKSYKLELLGELVIEHEYNASQSLTMPTRH